jgi:hypothetical protein
MRDVVRFDAIRNGTGVQSKSAYRFGRYHSFPEKHNDHSSAGVLSLFNRRCPSAVVGLISNVVVDPLNTIIRTWLRPHVSKKIFELFPSLANRQPSATITIVADCFGVAAPAFHVEPCSIFGRRAPVPGKTPRLPMRALRPALPAASRIAACETAFANDGIYTAFAPHHPVTAINSRHRTFDYQPPTEGVSSAYSHLVGEITYLPATMQYEKNVR